MSANSKIVNSPEQLAEVKFDAYEFDYSDELSPQQVAMCRKIDQALRDGRTSTTVADGAELLRRRDVGR